MENYIVSARKYRPSTFNSVVGQKSLTTTLKNAILTQKLAHAYLFCGPRGVGKTTCARIFAKTINCMHLTPEGEACNECESCRAFNEQRSYNIHELDAASNNSVEDIRSLIEQVRIPPQIGNYKVYIIDEVHMLSQAAFNAFLKTLEEPPHHAIFILATTEKHKILPTILSRCQIYDFNRISVHDTVEHLLYVAQQEHIHVEPEALNIIAQKADGGMRDALSIFDQIVSFTQGNVTYQSVIANLNVLDYEYFFQMTDLLLGNKVPDAMLLFNDILNKGFDGSHFITGLGAHFRDLLVSRDSSTLPLLEVGDNIRQRYQEQAMRCEPKFLYRAMKLCNDCDLNYRASKNKRLLVEITLIQLAQLTTDEDVPGCGQGPARTTLKPTFNQKTVAQQQQGASAPASSVQSAPQQYQQAATTDTSSSAAVPASEGKLKEPEIAMPETSSAQKIPTVNKSSMGFSIKNPRPTMSESSHAQTTVHQASGTDEDQAFSEQDLRRYWLEFAQRLPKEEAANAGRMKTMSPHLLDDNTTFEIVVDNEIVKKYMEDIMPKVRSYLCAQLHNSKVSMTVRVSNPQEVVKAYNRVEQYQMMNQKNPQLQHLREEFGLEFS
ncbi:MAG TPA: DNA polymerase III subunit gamma/tau [Bacteroides sp.]|nr:DNA polymerase III subunit gamma/tau [Phocaeicola coprophilus]HBB07436.1 DNA polymerase III subunit gamma/tau [Bacteroides sp.]